MLDTYLPFLNNATFSQIIPSPGPLCVIQGPVFVIKVSNVVSRLKRVAILSAFWRFESPGPNICTLRNRVQHIVIK